MARGEGSQLQMLYKDFVIFIDDTEALEKYKGGDTSIPLAQVMGNFDVYKKPELLKASDQELETEFSTKDAEKVIKTIIEKGELQKNSQDARQGPKNDSRGPNLTR